MQQLIDDLKSIPGVIGSYVFRSNGGVLCSNLPSIFKPDRIADMTKSLIKIHSAGMQNFPDLVEVFINYEESMLFCRHFNASDYVIAICDPGMNLGVLAMSLNMALEEVAGRVEAAGTSPYEVEEEALLEQPASLQPSEATSAPNFENSPLAEPLEEMSKMLAKILGPMALIVFDETVAKWAAGRTPSASDLPELVDRLCQEIDDSEKAKRYKELVHSYLPAA